MDKLLTYPGKTHNGIHTFVIDEERGYLTKTASEYHPTVASYINEAKKIPGVMQVLLTALGATEFWGPNVNGDGFREVMLAHPGPDYGYETFKHYAKVFKHHVNKDPKASYGNILLAVYNPVYHRVELVIGIDEKKAPDIIERMESGDYPVWSMGTKIPYDVCSICGNKAPTRKHYCEHLRYMLNQIDPETGRLVYADNIRPKFFDISYVLIPADKTAMTLKKVAFDMGAGMHRTPAGLIVGSAELAEKAAQMHKRSTMKKTMPAEQPPGSQDVVDEDLTAQVLRGAAEARDREPRIPTSVLDRLSSRYALPEILSSMSALLILPKPQEFQRLYIKSLDLRGKDELADKLEKVGACFDPLADWGAVTQDHYDAVDVSTDNIRPEIVSELMPYLEKRSFVAPLLAKRMEEMAKTASSMDPTYHRPAFIGPEEDSEGKKSNILPVLGASALLYLALTNKAVGGGFELLKDLVSKHPMVATAMGTTAALMLTGNKKDNMPRVRGRFSPQYDLQTDTNDIYDRLERMKQRPYVKVGAEKDASQAAAVAKRLFIGVPSVQMGSTMLQKHRRTDPYSEEGRISSMIRNHPHLVSGLVVADAMLATKGKGSYALTKHLGPAQKSWLKGEQLAKAAGVLEDDKPDLFGKSATASDYVVSSLVWPVAFGTRNLPGRIVGSVFDQAALDAGEKLLERSAKKSSQPQADKKLER